MYELKYDDHGHIIHIGFFGKKEDAEQTIARTRMVPAEDSGFGPMRFLEVNGIRFIDQEGKWVIDPMIILDSPTSVRGMSSKAFYEAEKSTEQPYADEPAMLDGAIGKLAGVLGVKEDEIVPFDPDPEEKK